METLHHIALPVGIISLLLSLPVAATFVQARILGLSLSLKTCTRYSLQKLGNRRFLYALSQFEKSDYDIPQKSLEQHFLETGDLIQCFHALEFCKEHKLDVSYAEICQMELKGLKPLVLLQSTLETQELIIKNVSSGKIAFDLTLKYRGLFPDYFTKGRDKNHTAEYLHIELESVLAAWTETDPLKTKEMLEFTVCSPDHLLRKLGIQKEEMCLTFHNI